MLSSMFNKAYAGKWWRTLKRAGQEFAQGEAFIYSASVAFYTLLSLPAMVFIALMAAGSLYEDAMIREELLTQIQSLVGSGTADQVRTVMANASISGDNLATRIISAGALVVSATTVFVALQNSLNNIWYIKPVPKKGYLKWLLDRVLSLAMVLSVGFLLIVSMVADTLINVFNDLLSTYLTEMTFYVVFVANHVVAFALNTVVFALIYKVLPDAHVEWRDVWRGALFTAILFFIGKYLIGLYVGNTPLTDTYGAAGSLVVLLLWVYYSVIIFLFGAEITYAYAVESGRQIVPASNAIIAKKQEVELEQDSQAG